MKNRKITLGTKLASGGVVAALLLATACGASTTDTSESTDTTSTASTTASQVPPEELPDGPPSGGPGGPGNMVDVDSVSTEDELIALIQEAYGDGGLDLHRGHQPVQDVLDEVLSISHDELHVRMEEQRQNLADVATDIGVDPEDLIEALVEAWSPAIDNTLAAGAITEDEAAAYEDALREAFTFRVTWDGQEATPTFDGLDA